MSKTIEVKDFLVKHGLAAELLDLEIESDKFCEELGGGLAVKDSTTLACIPTFVTTEVETFKNKPIIVIDAGGTNLRVATVIFDDNGGAKVDYFKKYAMPGTHGEIDYDEFNRTVADYLMPVINESDYIGMCFSYECDITPERDGKIISMSKEVYVNGAAGKHVCENLSAELIKRGIPQKTYCLINDTVASLMGGVAVIDTSKYDGFIGFILGTGTNMCYSEPCENIDTVKEAKIFGKSMIINVEGGKYGSMPRALLDVELDAGTLNVGDHMFEKMVGGAYQGALLLSWLKTACAEGMFSDNCANNFNNMTELTGMQIDTFCVDAHAPGYLRDMCDTADDVEALLLMIDAFYDRMAKLVTMQFAGTLKRTGKGTYKSRPVGIVAEGTTFYKSIFFRPKLNVYVSEYIERKMCRYVEFLSAENANLVGTAAVFGV